MQQVEANGFQARTSNRLIQRQTLQPKWSRSLPSHGVPYRSPSHLLAMNLSSICPAP